MNWILVAIITGTVTFAATNIDDIFILMLFFSQVNRFFRPYHIVVGQYFGFTALVLISLLGFLGSMIIPRSWIGLLGLVPIGLGVRSWKKRKERQESAEVNVPPKSGAFSSVISVAAVTFANGGDNIGIYTPLFAKSDVGGLLIVIVVFYVLIGVWCYVGYVVTRHPAVAHMLTRYGHLIVPFILIGLGIFIILDSGTLALFGL